MFDIGLGNHASGYLLLAFRFLELFVAIDTFLSGKCFFIRAYFIGNRSSLEEDVLARQALTRQ